MITVLVEHGPHICINIHMSFIFYVSCLSMIGHAGDFSMGNVTGMSAGQLVRCSIKADKYKY